MTALELARRLCYAARANDMADAPVALLRMLQSEGYWFMHAKTQKPMAVTDEFELLLTMNEAARAVKVCRQTIANWIRAGKVKTVTLASGERRVLAKSLCRYESDIKEVIRRAS